MEPNIRRCVACRKAAPKSEFWRIVRLHPSHAIVLDKGIGRSAYLCPHESCLKIAQKKNRLGKALKAPVPESIYHELETRLHHLPSKV
ncbi:putative nucleic-acid-binding protein implicated in transcription termination [Leptolyngbyaceae cyanobacterium JSC-12]|nr:putative nucleic-acid-binding protein implicated in transcription termination [Leptolyngbyaceae cyanobacterium JSC-12]